jgi:hypothetical protein
MLNFLQHGAGGSRPYLPGGLPSDRKLRLFACACARQVWHLLTDDQRVKVVFAEAEPWHQAALGGVHAEYLAADSLARFARTISQDRCLAYACGWLGAASSLEVAEQVPAWVQQAVPLPIQANLLRCVVGNPWRPAALPVSHREGCDAIPDAAERAYSHCNCGCPWLTPTVRALAQQAYVERPGQECTCVGSPGNRFGTYDCPACHGTGRIDDGSLDPLTLSALADALEEAGCDNEDVLRHLRGEEQVYEWREWKTGAEYKRTKWRPINGPHVRGCHAVDLMLGKG